MPDPQVRTGMRSPADLEALIGPDGRAANRPPPRLAPRPSKPKTERYAFPTKFRSMAETFKTLVNIRTPTIDGSGRMIDNKFWVSFANNQLDITRTVYPFSVELVSKALQSLSGYGIGRNFWNLDEELAVTRENEKRQLISRVKKLNETDPEMVAALRASLEDDFKTDPTDQAAPAA